MRSYSRPTTHPQMPETSGNLQSFGTRKGDDGFTLLEMLIVIIVTSILAGIFAVTLSSAIQIYTDHNIRKTSLIDSRRTLDMITHDLREWSSWQTTSSDELEFEKTNRFQIQVWFWTRTYYDWLRVSYNFDSGSIYYQRNDDGNWGNRYFLMTGGTTAGSQFSISTLGGTDRVSIDIYMTIRDRPLRFHTTIFPRSQGG